MFKAGDKILLTDECIERWYLTVEAWNSHKIGGAGGHFDLKSHTDVKNMLFDIMSMKYDKTPATILRVIDKDVCSVDFGNYVSNVGTQDIKLYIRPFDKAKAVWAITDEVSKLPEDKLNAILEIMGIKL